MTKIFGVFLIFIGSFLLAINLITYFSQNELSPQVNALYTTIQEFAKGYKKKTGFHPVGIGGGSCDDEKGERKYDKFFIAFETNRTLSKDEGRVMIIEAANELGEKISKNKILSEKAIENPLGLEYFDIALYINTDKKQRALYPNIGLIHLYKGKISYCIEKESEFVSYYVEDEETIEEALEIIKLGSSSSSD